MMPITRTLQAARWSLLLLLPACGGAQDKPAPSGEGNAAAQQAAEIVAAFVPAADQFGVKTFKVVYALEGQETGTRTIWVEDHGARVGLEDSLTSYGQAKWWRYYWDGTRSYMQNLPDGEVATSPVRTKPAEPSAFATTPAASLERAGYTRLGEKTILGKTCEHWKNEQFNYEGCRWQHLELEFMNGAGGAKILQRTVATDFVEGEAIPSRITSLGG